MNNIKEALENMSVSEAADYFRNERNISQRIQILKNMNVEQIVSLIKSENNVRLFLTQLDDDKLLNVVNNLDEDGIKKIFEKPLNEYSDIFSNSRNTLIAKLKNKGLTESVISIFKKLGYTDFDNEVTHSNVNPIDDMGSNETQTSAQANNTFSSTDSKSIEESNGNIININQAISDKERIKKSINNYLKSLNDVSDLYLNSLNEISNSKILDNFLGEINELKNKNIDKTDLDEYVDFFTSLKDINKKVVSKKKEIELRIKSVNDEFNSVNQKREKIDREIYKLKNEISKINDPNNKNIKEQELLKLEKEKDDLIDLINYLFQGDKYLQGKTFLNKNKNIPQSIQSRITKSTQQQPVNPAQPQPANPAQPQPANPAQTQPVNPAQPQPVNPTQPQPANPAQTQPANPAQPTQPSQTVINSIKYHIEIGDLPNNLTETEYLELTDALSIPANNDINYVLNNDELKRLLTSKKVMMAIINQTTKNAHNDSINKYNNLIQEYKKILFDMDIYSASKKERKSIEDMINNLENINSKYKSSVDSLGFDSLKEYINFNSKDTKQQNNQTKKIEKVSNKINKNDELLKEKYRLLKELEDKKAKNPKFKDNKLDKRIGVLNRQIKELQRKQINLNTTQTMIVNKNTNKYIAKVSEKQQRYNDEQRLASAHAEKMIDFEYKRAQLKDEKEKLKNDIKTMAPTDKEQKKQAKRDIAKINSKIAALKLKSGYCSLENQVCSVVALSGYTK